MTKPKALEGVKIIDFTRILAGPFCTQILADLGAEIIKIERPGPPSDERTWIPFKEGETTYFLGLNRGKRSIELNFKNPKAIEICKQLIKDADVVVENFSPGTMADFGLDYEELKKINPRIIMCSISAYGQYGPYSHRVGYDMLAQAMGGMMSITGYPDGPPTRVGASLGDLIAALYAAIGICAALHYRQLTGVGQYIDMALVDGIFTVLENAIPAYLNCGVEPKRLGNRHPNGGPYDTYTAKDGYVAIVASNERLWGSLCRLMGKPELAIDPKFDSNASRMANVEEMTAIINEWTSQYTVKELVAMLEEARVACSPVYTIPQICADPHIEAREMILEFDHPKCGKIKVPGNPLKFSVTSGAATLPPPIKGQHTVEVLKELGYTEAQIEEMAKSKVTTV
ncbi:MAG: CoA transferase [Firmicutes bacterium]|nr:CoA transferase [Bacillota bacterium]